MAKPIHSMIRVLDEARSVDFYRRAFGMEHRRPFRASTVSPWSTCATPEDDFELELTINHDRTEPYTHGDGYGHIAFVVDDSTPSMRASTARIWQPEPVKEFHREGALMAKFFFVTDPDGYRIEVLQTPRPLSLTTTRRQRREKRTNERQSTRRTKVSRRVFLRGSATAVPAAAVAAAGMSITAKAAWAQDAKNLKPHTMATLARTARDIYPHDQPRRQSTTSPPSAGYDAKAAATPRCAR